MILVNEFAPLILSVATIFFALFLYFSIKKIQFEKNKASQLTELVADGLAAFSKRILSNILQFNLYLTIVLFIFSYLFNKPFYWEYILSFFIGSLLMSLFTLLVLPTSPKIIPRILSSSKGYIAQPLGLLFQASTLFSFLCVGLIIVGLLVCFYSFGSYSLIGYAAGVIVSSYFLRVGGGVYKTATDIGAGIISQIDDDIPTFDHRSPGTLLDISGDYVGNLSGFSSDIIGSFILSFVAIILFPFSLFQSGMIEEELATSLLMIPIFVLSIGFISSFLSYFLLKLRVSTKHLSNVLLEGIYFSVFFSGIAIYFFLNHLNLLIKYPFFFGHGTSFSLFLTYIIGLCGAILIGFTSEFLTSNRYSRAKKIASQAEYGTVIILLRSFGMGLRSIGVYVIYILAVILFSIYFSGLYGIPMAALGMLSMTPTILVSRLFSPLAVNVKKVGYLSCDDTVVKNNLTKMDNIGLTTIALGNGFVTGTSIISSLSLFFCVLIFLGFDLTQLLMMDALLLSGIFLGVTFPFLFSGLLLSGLYKVVLRVCAEVSRQFKEIPFLYEDKAKPDISKAADNIARRSMDALIIPGFLLGLTPIFIGYILGVKLLLGFMIGVLLTGFNQGFFWANFGDVLHNAKNYIADGHYGGRETTTFSHISIADNFGDSFKDLLSPSINIMIKLIIIISALVMVFLT